LREASSPQPIGVSYPIFLVAGRGGGGDRSPWRELVDFKNHEVNKGNERTKEIYCSPLYQTFCRTRKKEKWRGPTWLGAPERKGNTWHDIGFRRRRMWSGFGSNDVRNGRGRYRGHKP